MRQSETQKSMKTAWLYRRRLRGIGIELVAEPAEFPRGTESAKTENLTLETREKYHGLKAE
jgi:hypothetical protein